VADEVKRGSMAQIERKSKLLPYIRRRVTQGQQRLLMLLLVALNRDVNAGIAQVVGDANLSHGNHRQSRVFELVTNNLGNFFAQRFRNALRAMHSVCSCELRVSGFELFRTRNSKPETRNFY